MPRRSPSAVPGIDPLDAQLGRTIRIARKAKGWSQQTLAARLGLSGQQLQKYESGVNRIAASSLFRLAQALDHPPAAFFPVARTSTATESAAPDAPDLARLMARISSEEHRRALLVLAEALAQRGRT